MTPGNVRQGGSESTAIMIDDVTPDEFAKFLWVFYNPYATRFCMTTRVLT